MNCGRCQKCARALFYADAIGKLDAFSTTFDIDAFKLHKKHGLLRLLRHSVLDRRSREDREALAYLFEQNYPLPSWFELFRKKIGPSGINY
tara:strand:+ start:1118 stop:1390 length:273 start_codon:yes stop_codon:yes gene_type:complete